MEWTDESITRLRSLWQEGLSTAEIGRRMQITKNAVVGKAHRLDLTARPSPIRKIEGRDGAAAAPRTTASRTAPRPAAPKPATAVERPRPAAPVQAAPSHVQTVHRTGDQQTQAQLTPPAASQQRDNVRLLRPEMPNPVIALAPAGHAAPARAEERADNPEPRLQAASNAAPRRRGLTCCWPLGEPGTTGFLVCGGEPTQGKPYCAEHAALAYVKLRDRRDSVA
jgi:GcrA cell cycle regulator